MKDILSFLEILKFHNFINYFDLTYKVDSNYKESFSVNFKITEKGNLHSYEGRSTPLMKYVMLEIWKTHPKLSIKLNKEKIDEINKSLKDNSNLYYKKGNTVFKITRNNDEGYFVRLYEMQSLKSLGILSFIPYDLIDEVEIYFSNIKI